MASVYGGVSYAPQRRQLHQGVDILVACPGRLEDLINQGDVDLRDVDVVVVDEADRMADMGFLPAVRRLLEMTSPTRQTILFSATLDGDVAVLTQRYQRDPVRHESDVQEDAESDVEHVFWMIDRADRVAHTAEVVASASPSIIFTRTRHGADRLAKQLERAGVTAVAMHGGRSQNQRNRALKDFTTGRAQALVATDVAARGIHVEGVASVIHFDPAEDDKAYLHRSGRTARAGASGVVVSLVDGSQVRAAKRLQHSLGIGTQIPTRPIPTGDSAGPHREDRMKRPSTTAATSHRPTSRDHSGATLYVGNLPYSFTEDGLSAMFRDHGPVHSATIVKYKDSDRSRGFGFVVVGEGKGSSAIAEIDGREVAGRRLRVKAARPRG
jgi:superfamily II DNA/RNA helicase